MLNDYKSHKKHTRTRRKTGRLQSGVGIIEIMVTVMLLSIGFLAAAQMQIQGMRYSQSAYLQSQAYFMISDMMDRMRGNVAGVLEGAYDNKAAASNALNPQCGVNFCNEVNLARQDIYDWSTNLFNLRSTNNFVPLLPGSTANPASAQIIQQANGVYSIRVAWNEKIGNVDTAQALQLDFVPWL